MSIHFVAIHFSAAKNRQEITLKPYFGDSRSFKVIVVDTTKSRSPALVCAYLQAFSRWTRE